MWTGRTVLLDDEVCLVSWRLCPAVAAIPKVAALGIVPCQGGVAAAVAQLVERVLGKDEVMGSSPISSCWLFRSFDL